MQNIWKYLNSFSIESLHVAKLQINHNFFEMLHIKL